MSDEVKQALALVRQALDTVVTTKQGHITLQDAVSKIESALNMLPMPKAE